MECEEKIWNSIVVGELYGRRGEKFACETHAQLYTKYVYARVSEQVVECCEGQYFVGRYKALGRRNMVSFFFKFKSCT